MKDPLEYVELFNKVSVEMVSKLGRLMSIHKINEGESIRKVILVKNL